MESIRVAVSLCQPRFNTVQRVNLRSFVTVLIYSFISFYKRFAKCLELYEVQGIEEKYNVVSALETVILVSLCQGHREVP